MSKRSRDETIDLIRLRPVLFGLFSLPSQVLVAGVLKVHPTGRRSERTAG